MNIDLNPPEDDREPREFPSPPPHPDTGAAPSRRVRKAVRTAVEAARWGDSFAMKSAALFDRNDEHADDKTNENEGEALGE